jgi:3',5'-cyclic AMP phosphodiesterase CpdA
MLMLHISNIHFKKGEVGEPDDPNKGLRDDLIEDVKYMRGRLGAPGMVLLSGDIAYAGRQEEYDFAYSWLGKELCPAARCDIENVISIPGNHDIDLSAEDGPGFKASVET